MNSLIDKLHLDNRILANLYALVGESQQISLSQMTKDCKTQHLHKIRKIESTLIQAISFSSNMIEHEAKQYKF